MAAMMCLLTPPILLPTSLQMYVIDRALVRFFVCVLGYGTITCVIYIHTCVIYTYMSKIYRNRVALYPTLAAE